MFEESKTFFRNAYEVTAFLVRAAKNGSLYNPIRSIKAATDECVILGNGPSLAESFIDHPLFCAHKTTFCMGEFSASEYYTQIKPAYYLCIDAVFYSSQADAQFNCVRTRTFSAIAEKTTWPMTVITPLKAKREGLLESLAAQNANVRLAYYNNSQIIGPKAFRHLMYRMHLGCPIFQNTLIAGIFFALNMGHRTVYVMGADHSWLEDTVVNDDNVLCIRRGYHFSDKGDRVLVPNMRTSRGDVFKMHEFLQALAITFEGYFFLEDYARFMGSKIYNASKKSYIDAFERLKVIHN